MKKSARLPAALLVISAILGVAAGGLRAESIISVGSVQAVPGSEFDVLLTGKLDNPIRGFQVGVEFPQFALNLLSISLDGSSPAQRPDIFERQISQGFATLKVIAPLSAPFPAGASVPLARLRFRMADGLTPGSSFSVEPKGNLGFPPVPALIYTASGSAPPAQLVAGAIKVLDKNLLRIRDLTGVRPGTTVTVEFSAFNLSPLQGFSMGVRFDPSLVRFLDVDFSGTITEAVGVEYTAPIFDNTHGTFVLGVLLDYVPPYENQVIPAAGLDLTIAKARVQVLPAPAGTSSINLDLVDGLGAPPIRNLFVIDNQSVPPEKRGGTLSLLIDGPFIRGDVNGDGALDISDPIAEGDWLFRESREVECEKAGDANDDGKVNLNDLIYILLFLFDRGPILPAPYPQAGLDPTADNLRCPPH